MPFDPDRGYRALRRGRYSLGGAEYFITFCTQHRQAGLATEPVASRILGEILHMEADGVWVPRCAVVMPDHVHLLVQLGDRLPLGRTVARLKSKSAAALKATGIEWQEGYHEHWIRARETRLPLFVYVYLNPYRAGLLARDAIWPWFVCGMQDRKWFLPMLNAGLPEPAWLEGLR